MSNLYDAVDEMVDLLDRMKETSKAIEERRKKILSECKLFKSQVLLFFHQTSFSSLILIIVLEAKVFRGPSRHPHRQRAANRSAVLPVFPRDGEPTQVCTAPSARNVESSLHSTEERDGRSQRSQRQSNEYLSTHRFSAETQIHRTTH